MEQLMVTPVSRLGLMLGKLAPYALVGAAETLVVLLLMRFLFLVPISGSLLLLAGFCLIFLFTSLGLGLLISTIAGSQMEAIQLAFVVMLPSILLSALLEALGASAWADDMAQHHGIAVSRAGVGDGEARHHLVAGVEYEGEIPLLVRGVPGWQARRRV